MGSSDLYVVTGVTGRTGSVVAKTLLETGQRVRVVIRNIDQKTYWQSKGAEVVLADLMKKETLGAAFHDADCVYIVSPPQYSSERLFSQAEDMASNIADAVRGAGITRVVALSSVGADKLTGTGWIAMNRMLEEALVHTNVSVALLRAAYFMENLAPLVEVALKQKQFHSFLSPLDKQFSMIATEDIGHIAARIMTEKWSGVRVVELVGPSSYSPNDVASCVSDIVAESITAHEIPVKDWSSFMEGAGFSQAGLQGFIDMTRALNSGHISFGNVVMTERYAGQLDLRSVIVNLLAE